MGVRQDSGQQLEVRVGQERRQIDHRALFGVDMRQSRHTASRFILCAILISSGAALYPPQAPGAPAIAAVQGLIADGQSITIAGAKLGPIGPAIALFDDFEKGTNGIRTLVGLGSAQVGAWDSIAALPTKYSDAFAHSGALSNMSDWSDNGAHEGSRWIEKTMRGGATEVYFSWWAYLPANRDVPGTNTPWGPNWKLFWLYHHPWPASDYVFTLMTNNLPVGNPPKADYFLMAAADDRNPPMRANFDTRYGPSTFIKGRWHRWEVYMKGSTTDGTLQAWEMNSGVKRTQIASRGGVVTIHAGETWDTLHFPGYGRGDTNSQTYYDDIYVATGNGARARVEIGNAPKYTDCTNLAVLTPTSWSDAAIIATMRQGSFHMGDTAYIFVLDPDGVPNSRGYQVTIGRHADQPKS